MYIPHVFVPKRQLITPRHVCPLTINKPMSLSTKTPSTFPTRLHVVYPQKAFNRKDLLPLGSDYLWEIEQGIVRSLTWNEEGQEDCAIASTPHPHP